jgi:hypothetical protein
MRGSVREGRLRALCLGFLAMLAGCMVQLAPPFDTTIVAGLSSANQDIHTLFAQVGSATSPETFNARKPQYDRIVAELGATETQIRTRPMPSPAAIRKAAAALARIHVADVAVDPNFTVYPSARAVADLKDTILHMEAADEKTGLRGGLLAAFENQAEIFLTQAMTYENYLKR